MRPAEGAAARGDGDHGDDVESRPQEFEHVQERLAGLGPARVHETLAAALLDRANLTGIVLGCIEAKFTKIVDLSNRFLFRM